MTFLTEAWFWRGTQSAVFYYLSCAPCSKVSDQRRKRRAAKRAAVTRAKAIAAQTNGISHTGNPSILLHNPDKDSLHGPATVLEDLSGEVESDIFRHPLPSGTNAAWEQEIFLGPGPPRRRMTKEERRKKDERDRALKIEREKRSVLKSTPSNHENGLDLDRTSQDRASEPMTLQLTNQPSSVTSLTLRPGNLSSTTRSSRDRRPSSAAAIYAHDEPWRYQASQREDEILWGSERASNDSPTDQRIRKPPTESNQSRTGFQYIPRNPDVNDLHPPVVSSSPVSKESSLWMLQPPPRAKFMEGKEKESILSVSICCHRSENGSILTSDNAGISRTNSRRSEKLGKATGESDLLQGRIDERTGSLGLKRLGSCRSQDSTFRHGRTSRGYFDLATAQHRSTGQKLDRPTLTTILSASWATDMPQRSSTKSASSRATPNSMTRLPFNRAQTSPHSVCPITNGVHSSVISDITPSLPTMSYIHTENNSLDSSFSDPSNRYYPFAPNALLEQVSTGLDLFTSDPTLTHMIEKENTPTGSSAPKGQISQSFLQVHGLIKLTPKISNSEISGDGASRPRIANDHDQVSTNDANVMQTGILTDGNGCESKYKTAKRYRWSMYV